MATATGESEDTNPWPCEGFLEYIDTDVFKYDYDSSCDDMTKSEWTELELQMERNMEEMNFGISEHINETKPGSDKRTRISKSPVKSHRDLDSICTNDLGSICLKQCNKDIDYNSIPVPSTNRTVSTLGEISNTESDFVLRRQILEQFAMQRQDRMVQLGRQAPDERTLEDEWKEDHDRIETHEDIDEFREFNEHRQQDDLERFIHMFPLLHHQFNDLDALDFDERQRLMLEHIDAQFIETNFFQDGGDFVRHFMEDIESKNLTPLYPVGAAETCMCAVCYEVDKLHLRACCQLPVCERCLKQYFQTMVEQGIVKLQCVNPGCEAYVHRNEIASLLEPEMKSKFYKYLVDANKEPHIKTCPRCSAVMTIDKMLLKEKRFKTGLKVICAECTLEWCFPCQAPYHDNVTCKQYRKGDKQLKHWAKEQHYGQQNAQKCPRCKVFIQRSSGCDHMTCSRCKTDFCYRCGERYRSLKFIGNHYSRFSVFGCKYRFKPHKPVQRKLIRGALFGGKLVAAPVLAGLALGAGGVLVGVGVVALPFYGSYKLIKAHQRRKERQKYRARRQQAAIFSANWYKMMNQTHHNPGSSTRDTLHPREATIGASSLDGNICIADIIATNDDGITSSDTGESTLEDDMTDSEIDETFDQIVRNAIRRHNSKTKDVPSLVQLYMKESTDSDSDFENEKKVHGKSPGLAGENCSKENENQCEKENQTKKSEPYCTGTPAEVTEDEANLEMCGDHVSYQTSVPKQMKENASPNLEKVIKGGKQHALSTDCNMDRVKGEKNEICVKRAQSVSSVQCIQKDIEHAALKENADCNVLNADGNQDEQNTQHTEIIEGSEEKSGSVTLATESVIVLDNQGDTKVSDQCPTARLSTEQLDKQKSETVCYHEGNKHSEVHVDEVSGLSDSTCEDTASLSTEKNAAREKPHTPMINTDDSKSGECSVDIPEEVFKNDCHSSIPDSNDGNTVECLGDGTYLVGDVLVTEL